MNKRMTWLIIALLATLAAVFWTQQETDDGLVEAVARHPAQTGQAAPASATSSQGGSAAAGVRLGAMQADLFPSQTWVPPPPPPKRVKPPPPPAPKPPPLPFTYVGRWLDGQNETVFLMQGNRTFPAKVGDVLPGAWRLEEITRRGVVFTYLPLDMQSTLGIKP